MPKVEDMASKPTTIRRLTLSVRKVLEEFMEVELAGSDAPVDVFGLTVQSPHQEWLEKKGRIERALASYGLTYRTGGRIVQTMASTPTVSIREALKRLDLAAVNISLNAPSILWIPIRVLR
jgi:hypothetical protein